MVQNQCQAATMPAGERDFDYESVAAFWDDWI